MNLAQRVVTTAVVPDPKRNDTGKESILRINERSMCPDVQKTPQRCLSVWPHTDMRDPILRVIDLSHSLVPIPVVKWCLCWVAFLDQCRVTVNVASLIPKIRMPLQNVDQVNSSLANKALLRFPRTVDRSGGLSRTRLLTESKYLSTNRFQICGVIPRSRFKIRNICASSFSLACGL